MISRLLSTRTSISLQEESILSWKDSKQFSDILLSTVSEVIVVAFIWCITPTEQLFISVVVAHDISPKIEMSSPWYPMSLRFALDRRKLPRAVRKVCGDEFPYAVDCDVVCTNGSSKQYKIANYTSTSRENVTILNESFQGRFGWFHRQQVA
jgi:hypothetical protein